MINRKKITLFVGVFSIVLLGIIAFATNNRSTADGIPTVQHVQVSFVTDFSDKRKLVGFADNVFVGEVIAFQETVNADQETVPETRFEVQVIENIKGNLQGVVVVNQEGGLRTVDNTLLLMEGSPLLEAGNTYLFATNLNRAGDYHTLVPVFGNIFIESVQKQQDMMAAYEEAYRNEIPFDLSTK